MPATFLNGEMLAGGKMRVEEVLAKLDGTAFRRTASRMAEKELYEVLVVGGGPEGATTKIYTTHKGFFTGIATERLGGQMLDTMGSRTSWPPPTPKAQTKLASQLKDHVGEYHIDVMNPGAGREADSGASD